MTDEGLTEEGLTEVSLKAMKEEIAHMDRAVIQRSEEDGQLLKIMKDKLSDFTKGQILLKELMQDLNALKRSLREKNRYWERQFILCCTDLEIAHEMIFKDGNKKLFPGDQEILDLVMTRILKVISVRQEYGEEWLLSHFGVKIFEIENYPDLYTPPL